MEAGAIRLSENVAGAETPIRPGLTLSYRFEGWEEPALPEFAAASQTLWQGEDLILVHKPPGIPVHKTSRILFQTLVRQVQAQFGEDYAPLHRLDMETSGLVAFARGPQAFRDYSPEFGATWIKVYLGLARGCPPGTSGIFNGPLGELPGQPIRSRMHVHPEGKPALTLWESIATQNGLTLMAVSPITGRKHQIRAHLAHAGLPLVGDKIYACDGRFYLKRLKEDLSADDMAELGAEHHLLHAYFLRIGTAAETASQAISQTVSMPQARGGEAQDTLWPQAWKNLVDLEKIELWKKDGGLAAMVAASTQARLVRSDQPRPVNPGSVA